MGTGVAPVIASELVRIGGDNFALVLLIGVGVCILFGLLGMIVAGYRMLALSLAPALEQMGMNTLAIHMFIAYYSMLAAITPPVALAAFIASRIADSDPMQTSWHACRLGIVLYFIPIFFLFEPALIFQGPLLNTILATTACAVAIMVVAGASEGWLLGFGLLKPWARIVMAPAGLLIAFPEWKTSATGIVIVAAVILLRRYSGVPANSEAALAMSAPPSKI
jgi:TRAP-type uncharacterized transport system fused permease subunit